MALSTGAGAQESADGDNGPRRLPIVVDRFTHLLGDPHGLLNEGLDDLGLWHRLDDLALDEDLTLAVARGDTKVRLTSLTRPVHDAAHDRDAQRHLKALESCRHLISQRVHIYLRAATRRTRDNLQLARAQIQRLQDLDTDLDLLRRGGGQGDADGVTNSF